MREKRPHLQLLEHPVALVVRRAQSEAARDAGGADQGVSQANAVAVEVPLDEDDRLCGDPLVNGEDGRRPAIDGCLESTLTEAEGLFVDLTYGARHACGLISSGTAECWGRFVHY